MTGVRVRQAVWLICLLVCANGAIAGPWLRDKGSGFLSASTLSDGITLPTANLYIEYGLSKTFTLGGSFELRTGGLEHLAVIFLRKPLGPRDAKLLKAFDLGLGVENTAPFLRVGLNIGRGIKLGETYGWATLDSAIDIFQGGGLRLKSDATLGLNLSDRWKVMGQIFAEHKDSDLTLKFAPSAVWTPKSGKQSYQFGFEIGDDRTAFRAGLWRDF